MMEQNDAVCTRVHQSIHTYEPSSLGCLTCTTSSVMEQCTTIDIQNGIRTHDTTVEMTNQIGSTTLQISFDETLPNLLSPLRLGR